MYTALPTWPPNPLKSRVNKNQNPPRLLTLFVLTPHSRPNFAKKNDRRDNPRKSSERDDKTRKEDKNCLVSSSSESPRQEIISQLSTMEFLRRHHYPHSSNEVLMKYIKWARSLKAFVACESVLMNENSSVDSMFSFPSEQSSPIPESLDFGRDLTLFCTIHRNCCYCSSVIPKNISPFIFF